MCGTVRYIYPKYCSVSRKYHTTLTSPPPVYSAKLSIVVLSYYYSGVPYCNTECGSFVALNINGYAYTMEHYCTAQVWGLA